MDFPIIDLKLTGRRIKELCKQADLSALQIKRHLNLCCVQTVYKWFSGRNVPTIENFYALSLMLGVSMEDLLVIRNQPDHSIFWQKNTQCVISDNARIAARMMMYRAKICRT